MTVSHPVFARFYERFSVVMDRAGTAEQRHALVTGLQGRIIEIRAGNGRTVWPRLFAGCNTGRDTVTAITAAGFSVDELHRFRFPPTGPASPAAPHVRGSATRRTDATPGEARR